MSFRLGDIIVKEILFGTAFDLRTLAPQYVLTQLSEATIDITAESVDVTDKSGNIVKRIYRAKSGEFSATNAFVNANIIQASSGSDAVYAGDGTSVVIPMMQDYKAAATGATTIDLKLTEADAATVKINKFYGDGTLGDALTLTTDYTVSEAGVVVIQEGKNGDAPSYFVTYDKTFTENAAMIQNRADKFPDTVKMVFKVAYYDPCDKSSVKAAYVVIENFMVSPETSISLSADTATMDISATMELDYCSSEKEIYKMFFYDEEE